MTINYLNNFQKVFTFEMSLYLSLMNRLLLFLIFLTPLCVNAQADKTLAKNGLPKNAKVIALESELEGDKLFESVARILFDQGYEINSSDKHTGIIQTDNKNVKAGWYLRISISVSGKSARLRGNTYLPRLSDDELINYGMKGSLNLMAFSEMARIAKLIPHTSIEYLP